MGLLGALERLDRRWIFLAVGLLVLVPLVWPLHLPLEVSKPVRDYHAALAAVPRGSTVLVSCDYDPATRAELEPMTESTLRQLFDQDCKVVVVVLWNGAPVMVDEILERVAREKHRVYGVDYVNLGYKSGNEAVMVLMGQGVANAFPSDQRGADTRRLPVMRDVRNYASFPLLVSLSAGYPGTKEYVQQVGSRFHIPIVAGVTAVSAPEFYPYLQSGQLRGMLGGMAGAAEYEKLRGESGAASRGMDAQSLAHLFIGLCIVMGNVVYWGRRRRGAP